MRVLARVPDSSRVPAMSLARRLRRTRAAGVVADQEAIDQVAEDPAGLGHAPLKMCGSVAQIVEVSMRGDSWSAPSAG